MCVCAEKVHTLPVLTVIEAELFYIYFQYNNNLYVDLCLVLKVWSLLFVEKKAC